MKKYTLIILSSLLLAFTSCNNWLDVELDNKIEDTKLFTSASGFKEALAGVYSELSKSPLYGQRLSMEYMDILAGFYSYNAIRSTYEDWKDYDYESSASASVISGIWNSMYSNIAQVNCILYWADENASMLNKSRCWIMTSMETKRIYRLVPKVRREGANPGTMFSSLIIALMSNGRM